jgi:hypothetical protein
MSIYRANDKYRATLRSTWIADPPGSSLQVTAVPANVPTIVVVGWETDYETVFGVEGKSGDSPSTYALTGVTRLKGANINLPENTPVNCLNNEEFFNQYLLTSTWYDLSYSATPTIDGDNGPKQRITLSGNATFSFDNIPDARVFMLRVTQDGVGGRTVSWDAGVTITWLTPTTDVNSTASATTVYGFMETGTDTYDGYLMGYEY